MRKSLLILAAICLLTASCGKKAVVKKTDSPGNLYVEGLAFMKKKDYDKAIKSFSKVRENYPFDPIALVAQVKQADSEFEKKAYLAAAAIYDDFVNSYPEDENAAYALRRLAECYEKTSPSIERDQANTFKAVERFTFLKNRYPASPYAKDADEHLKKLNLKLAAREFYIGQFYYKWGKYNASIIRLQYFLEKYPEANDRDKAMYLICQDYRELQNPEKADAFLDKLKKEYPTSIYAQPGLKRPRKRLKLAQSTAAGSAVATAGGTAEMSAQAAAGGTTQGSAKAAAPEISYGEKETRHIDLRPVETQGAPTGGSAAPQGEGAESQEGPQAGAAKPATAASQTPAAEGHKGQPPGQGGKKDSLGFFSQKKPVDVVADSMEGLEKGKVVVFRGNVIAKQEDLYLFSDVLTAYMNEETNEIDRAKAEGNVKIVKLDRTATCKEAFFYNDKGEIVLKGDAVVYSGKDKVSGDTVTYYINEDRVFVQGEKDKRAKAIITPK